FEPITIRATPKEVISTTAVDLILATPAEEQVGAARRISQNAPHQPRTRGIVARNEIIAIVTTDDVSAEITVKAVAIIAAVQFTASLRGFCCNNCRNRSYEGHRDMVDIHRSGNSVNGDRGGQADFRISVEEVDTRSAPQPL